MATYTGFIRFANPGYPDSIEEIDVVANTTDEARQRIQQELDDDYEPGGIIAHIEQRMGLFS